MTDEFLKEFIKQQVEGKKSIKRSPLILYPLALEKKYVVFVRSMLRPYLNITRKEIKPFVPQWSIESKRDSVLIDDNSDIHNNDDIEWYKCLCNDVDNERIKHATVSIINDAFPDELEELNEKYTQLQKEMFQDNRGDLKSELMSFAVLFSEFNKKQQKKVLKGVFDIDNIQIAEPWEDDLLKSWVNRNVNLIKGMSDDYIKQINEAILDGIQKDESIADLEKRLTKINKNFSKNRAKLIARDQTNKLNSALNKKRSQNVGADWYIWQTAQDERVRKTHKPLHGKICKWDDSTVYADSIADAKEEKWKKRSSIGAVELHPGQDIQCFLGQVEVQSLVGIEKLFRRRYTGKMTTFIMDSGETFECTPNHPILRSDGVMIAAKDLEIGDDIVHVPNETISAFSEGKKENRVPTFQEVFDFFSCLGLIQGVIGSIENFHGDGFINQDIDIINLEAELPDCFKSITDKNIIDEFFSKACSGLSFLDTNRYCFSMLKSMGFICNSFISFFSKLFPFFIGQISHTDKIGLTTVSKLNVIFSESFCNNISGNMIFFGKRKNTLTTNIFSDDLFIRKLFSIGRCFVMSNDFKASLSKLNRKVISTDVKNSRDFTKIFSGFHHTVSIKNKFVSEFNSVHVYNLQNNLSWYIITDRGFIVKNCRCSSISVFPEFADLTPEIKTKKPEKAKKRRKTERLIERAKTKDRKNRSKNKKEEKSTLLKKGKTTKGSDIPERKEE